MGASHEELGLSGDPGLEFSFLDWSIGWHILVGRACSVRTSKIDGNTRWAT